MNVSSIVRRRLLAGAGLVACLPALQAQPPVLRTVAQSGALVKYSPQDHRRPGMCAEILRAVERIDPGLRFAGQQTHAPLRRIERMLAQGEIDVFFCLLNTPERSQQWDYLPVPLYRVRHVVVQRIDDRTELLDLADLLAAGRRKPVLVAQGSALTLPLLRSQVPFSDVARSDLEALRMLALGRSDVVYGQDMTLAPLLREPELAGRLRMSATVFQEDTQYAVVAKHVSAAVSQRLIQALQTLERDGFLRALAEKYRQP
jgi:polar amino acid transport system substrate-binding protein